MSRSWMRRHLLLFVLVVPLGAPAVAASLPPEQAVQERARAGAWAHPAAAWHHLLLARDAVRDGDRATAALNYRLAVSLDPDFLPAWLGLVQLGVPSDPSLIGEGMGGALRSLDRSWEVQRRLLAAVIPPLWTATTIAATLLLLAIGLRHLPRRRHVLLEGFRPHLGPGRARLVATLLCFVPMAVQWGFAASSSAYAGLTHGAQARRERSLAILALLWLLVMPGVWRMAAPYAAPIQPSGPAWLIARAERETPTPELGQAVTGLDARGRRAQSAFAAGMVYRRTGRLSDAESAFKRAAAEESAVSSHASVNLGNLRLWKGDPTGAARIYESMLDSPVARLEARYNLAIALSRLHRFEEADQRLEEAARLDFDRVRSATRTGDPQNAADVMDGQLGPRELWAVEAAAGSADAPVPPFLSWLHPGGRSTATPLAMLAALILGLIAGKIIEARLRVHSCTRCGGPVCRRCVTRAAGHSYCRACASALHSHAPGDHSRLLLRRVLGEERLEGDRVRAWGTILLPGVGLILRGRPLSGGALTWFFAFGFVLLTRAAWAFPPSIVTEGVEGLARLLGLVCMIASFACSSWMARRLLRQRSLRHFLDRDVYRMAA
jgi:tetratricopeptide (TPR) repeat protein